MHVVQSKEDLSCIEFSSLLAEFLAFSQVGKHLPTPYEVHHKEDFFFGLEGIFQTDEEGMLSLFKEISFSFCLDQMLLFDEIFLAHTLDRVIFAVFLVLAEHDLAKGSPP